MNLDFSELKKGDEILIKIKWLNQPQKGVVECITDDTLYFMLDDGSHTGAARSYIDFLQRIKE